MNGCHPSPSNSNGNNKVLANLGSFQRNPIAPVDQALLVYNKDRAPPESDGVIGVCTGVDGCSNGREVRSNGQPETENAPQRYGSGEKTELRSSSCYGNCSSHGNPEGSQFKFSSADQRRPNNLQLRSCLAHQRMDVDHGKQKIPSTSSEVKKQKMPSKSEKNDYCGKQNKSDLLSRTNRCHSNPEIIANYSRHKKSLQNDCCHSNQMNRDSKCAVLEQKHVHDVYEKMAYHFQDVRFRAWPRVKQFLQELEVGSLVADVGR